MSPTTQAPETLVVAKCSDCGLYQRGLTQEHGVAFRAAHAQHEGNALYAMESAPVPSTDFDPGAAAARLNTLAEQLGAQAENARGQSRSVQPTEEGEVARLQQQHVDELRISTPLMVGAVEGLLATTGAARALVAEVTPQLTAAVARLADARRDGVGGLENLQSIGELVEERRTQEREDLRRCQQGVDRIRRALTRLEPVTPLFLAALARHLRASARALTAHEVRRASVRIAALTVELETLRTPSEAFRLARTLATRTAELTGESIPFPVIRWLADDLLAPPALAE